MIKEKGCDKTQPFFLFNQSIFPLPGFEYHLVSFPKQQYQIQTYGRTNSQEAEVDKTQTDIFDPHPHFMGDGGTNPKGIFLEIR